MITAELGPELGPELGTEVEARWRNGDASNVPSVRHCTQQEKIRLSTSHSTPPTASLVEADSLSAARKGLPERLSEYFVSRNGNTLVYTCPLAMRRKGLVSDFPHLGKALDHLQGHAQLIVACQLFGGVFFAALGLGRLLVLAVFKVTVQILLAHHQA